MDFRQRPRVAVIGGKRATPALLETARRVGELLAERGAVLVCGGLSGIMQAAARGARLAGGLTVGILPGTDPAAANDFIDLPIVTGLGYTRNSLVALNADVLIAVDGEYGTLSEIAFALIYGRKVVGIKTWEIPGVFPARTAEEAVRLALGPAEP